MRRFPELAYRLTKLSFSRIQRLQVRLAEMMKLPAPSRLAIALLDPDERVGRDDTIGRKLTLPLTHADIARLIGTSREMVSILLRKVCSEGLVETGNGWTYLVDSEGLRKIAAAGKS